MNNRFQQKFLKILTLGLMVLSLYSLIHFVPRWFGIRFLEKLGFANLNTRAGELSDSGHKIYLPQAIKNRQNWINVDRIWTADIFEEERVAYLLGDTIIHNASGSNFTGETATADITWSLQSPCGSSEVFSDTLQLDEGFWSESYFTTLVDCIGIHTHTIQVTHKDRTVTETTQFVVNNPSAAILSDKPAFDICGAPSLYQMQRWMDESPYWGANIYIGGIHRACANSNLDAFWVHEVNQQGWQLIPTWVGPQASCSNFKYRIFSDPELARIQGRIEADAAYQAADQLGFMGGTNVIYYDLEGYVATSFECRQASASFLQGWTERLHEYGIRAGAYGGSCSSYMEDWAANVPMLDNVWIADWKIPFEYDEDASVYGVRCLDDPEILFWTNHQRIRQYAGDHDETWGGVTLGVDSNIADGEVVVITQGSIAQQDASVDVFDQGPSMQDFQLVSPGQGWALLDQRLLWTEDGGLNWSDITPMIEPAGDILSAYFSDGNHGWAVSRAVESGELVIYRTEDGGKTWSSVNWDHPTLGFGNAQLYFVDAATGWLALKQQTSANFSLGELFRTVDGGENWQQLSLPIGEPVHFIDALRGWVAGGVEGNELYVTNDGGVTWEPQNAPVNQANPSLPVIIGLPLIADQGVLAVTSDDQGESSVDLYITPDGGHTWEMVSPDSTALALVATLPEGTLKTTLADSNNAWVNVGIGTCSGNKNASAAADQGSIEAFECQVQSKLLQTTDSGQTWIEITPSDP